LLSPIENERKEQLSGRKKVAWSFLEENFFIIKLNCVPQVVSFHFLMPRTTLSDSAKQQSSISDFRTVYSSQNNLHKFNSHRRRFFGSSQKASLNLISSNYFISKADAPEL